MKLYEYSMSVNREASDFTGYTILGMFRINMHFVPILESKCNYWYHGSNESKVLSTLYFSGTSDRQSVEAFLGFKLIGKYLSEENDTK